MNTPYPQDQRLAFRDYLRAHLRRLEFYQRWGEHYLVREFSKYCEREGQPIDEASLGRYLRDFDPDKPEEVGNMAPVIPTPERCRALAKVLKVTVAEVIVEAGHMTWAEITEGAAAYHTRQASAMPPTPPAIDGKTGI